LEDELLLVTGGLLFLAVGAAWAASRISVPTLVAFLGLGMLLGSDGVGGIEFSDAGLAREIGVICLVAILFEGGLTTRISDTRPVAVPAVLLGTVGVVVTAVVIGAAARVLFDLSWSEGLLLGAVVGSTDAAAVFATLRQTGVRPRLGAALEAESGINDPMAVALTLGLISWVSEPDYGAWDMALLLVQQLGIGLVFGVVIGVAAAWAFARLPERLAPFAPIFSLACAAVGFGAAAIVGGSGFLAVYLVGVLFGNATSPHRGTVASFHEGIAFLSQIVLFIVLGLLVFPSDLIGVIVSGVILAAVLTLVARPLAVAISTLGFSFSMQERALLSWAGLRGAVPIVLATFPLSEGLAESETIFNAVFFVVLVSVLLQGTTLSWVAERLGLAEDRPLHHNAPIDPHVMRSMGSDALEYVVQEGDDVAGTPVRELRLPEGALVAVIIRGDEAIPPRGSTVIQPGDRLYIIARGEVQQEVMERLAAWGAEPKQQE
jgi:cell volume regulation protein A